MRHQRLKFRSEFRVVPGSRRGQCAEMAIGRGRRVRLRAGSLVFIARGERHQVRNAGRVPLPRGRK